MTHCRVTAFKQGKRSGVNGNSCAAFKKLPWFYWHSSHLQVNHNNKNTYLIVYGLFVPFLNESMIKRGCLTYRTTTNENREAQNVFYILLTLLFSKPKHNPLRQVTVLLTVELLKTVLMTTVTLQNLPTLSISLTKPPDSFKPATVNLA